MVGKRALVAHALRSRQSLPNVILQFAVAVRVVCPAVNRSRGPVKGGWGWHLVAWLS